jgi:hypothetical protein
MSENTVRLCNRRRQPVELHLPYGVIVLPPGGETVVPASQLTTPQLAWLVDSGKLSAEPVAAASESSDPDVTAAADTPEPGDAAGDQESDASPAAGPAGAARPKRDTARRGGRAHKA